MADKHQNETHDRARHAGAAARNAAQGAEDVAQQGAEAVQQGSQAAADAVRQGAQAVQQGGQAGAEVIRRAGDAGAEAMRRGGEAGAQAMQRGGQAVSESLRQNAEVFADSQREFLQRAADQFEEVSRKVAEAAQGTSDDVRAFLTLPNYARGGLNDLQQSVTSMVEGVVRTNLRAAQQLFQLANPAAFVELQQRFVRDYLDALLEGTATLVRATRRTADETLRPLEHQLEQRRQAVANDRQRYQTAAE